MGDRSQVHIEDSDVYLYTHWDGRVLPEVLREALAVEERWGDHEYLARIIFDHMVGDGQGETTGYGIGSGQHGYVYRVAHVNCAEQTVTLENGVAGWHDDDDAVSEEYSFEEFVNLEPSIEWPER